MTGDDLESECDKRNVTYTTSKHSENDLVALLVRDDRENIEGLRIQAQQVFEGPLLGAGSCITDKTKKAY